MTAGETLFGTDDGTGSGALQGFTVGITADHGSAEQAALFERRGATVVCGASVSSGPRGLDAALPDDRRPAIRLVEAVSAGRVHAVTFTTGPAVRNWFAIAVDEGTEAPLRHALAGGSVVVGCAGAVCAGVAEDEGIPPDTLVVSAGFGTGSLVRSVAARLLAGVVRAGTSGTRIVVTGTVATVDGVSYCLTPTEARLLTALARRPNAVFSKEELLDTVWDGVARDPHVVEVVVARLRRRLEDNAGVITAIHRRGYALRI